MIERSPALQRNPLRVDQKNLVCFVHATSIGQREPIAQAERGFFDGSSGDDQDEAARIGRVAFQVQRDAVKLEHGQAVERRQLLGLRVPITPLAAVEAPRGK